MTAHSEVQESAARVLWICPKCGSGKIGGAHGGRCRNAFSDRCHAFGDFSMLERVEVVPLSVAENLAEALATIAADTHDYETAEGGRAWRVKLAHEEEQAFRAAYPAKETTG